MEKSIFSILLAACILIIYPAMVASQDADTTPPYVVATHPSSGQTGVPTGVSIHAVFSEGMDPGFITSNTFTLSTALGSENVEGLVSYGNKSATFILFGHLDAMTAYTATISGDVMDESGNSLGSDYSWTFTTGAE